MNIESKINVHQSSLVGLKAELLRKKSEVEAAKVNHQNEQYLNKQKEKIVKKSIKDQKKEEKRKKKQEREDKDEDPDIMKAHKKSQLMLQAKSRLYTQLSKTHTTINSNFLVDFENKPDMSDHSDDEKKLENNYDDYKSDYDNDSDSEWVEYTDFFGRSRKCLREDLPKMRREDDHLRNTISESRCDNSKKQMKFVEDREPMKEPAIEVMRRKWEEQMAKLANKDDIHYQDVLFDEARSHGVGYYAFSQDDEERAKQQESLTKLRKETERKQQENQQILEMKERIQQNRLKAARVRQRLRAGLPLGDPEYIDKTESNIELQIADDKKQDFVLTTIEVKKEKEDDKNSKILDIEESNKREAARKNFGDIENKVKTFGEMLGKRHRWYVMSQNEWVQKKRKERVNEFAPMYENFRQGEILNNSESTKNSTNSNDDYLREDSDIIDHIPPFQDQSNSDNVIESEPSLTIEDFVVPISQSLNKDFIEPVPPPIIEDFIGPLPSKDFIEPVSSPPKKDFQSSKDSKFNSNVNIEDQIVAGLKFLRQQFENKHKR